MKMIYVHLIYEQKCKKLISILHNQNTKTHF